MNEQEFRHITCEMQPALILIARKIIGDEEDVMSSLPTDAQNRLKVLGAMIDTYTDEMNTLQRNVDENYDNPTLRQSYIDQMKLFQEKRQELLDKVHQIILEETN